MITLYRALHFLLITLSISLSLQTKAQQSCISNTSLTFKTERNVVFKTSNFVSNVIRSLIKDEFDKLDMTPPSAIINDIKNKYDQDTNLKLAQWIELMTSKDNKDLPIKEKLELVNNFFNSIPYSNDKLTWQRDEYWATPLELIKKNKGDCEDYAIAKYITLRKLGIKDEDLRFAYVRSHKFKAAHMLLTYRESDNKPPLILDNNLKDIQKTSEQTMYVPIYYFNNKSLWKVDSDTKNWEARIVDDVSTHKKWQNLIDKLKNNL